MDRETIVERARAMAPVLAERAQTCEEQRRIPSETVEDCVEAGFFRVLQPAKYGGYELPPPALYDVVIELAHGCPSTAWAVGLMALHNWGAALLDPRVAEDLWSEDPNTRCSTSYAPLGTVEQVDGGYRLSGRWPWSSGCDHCQWVAVGAIGATPDGQREPLSLLVPRADYEIVDTWHAFGLKGTGSNDIVIKDVFVPGHRVHHFLDSFAMQDPGRETFTSRSYAYPFGVVFGMCLSAATQGIAEGALACVADQLASRRSAFDPTVPSEDPFIMNRLAETSAAIRNNRRVFDGAFEQMDALLDRGEALPIQLRAEIHYEIQRVAHANAAAVGKLFQAAGSGCVLLENPMQRYFRDVHTATRHAFLNIDRGGPSYGGVLLGHPTKVFVL